MYVLIKGRKDRPPNPRILVGDEEMKLSKWANRKAAEMMRADGKPASGPEWEATRNRLIEEVKTNPDTHNISYINGAPEGFATGGPREATDMSERIDTANLPPHLPEPKPEPQPEPVATQDEGQGSMPEKDPQQSSLFDFGMKMKKSEAMNYAWSYLNG